MSRTTLRKLAKTPFLANGMTKKELDEVLDYIDSEYYDKGISPIPDDSYDAVMAIYGERFPRSARMKRVGARTTNLTAEVPLLIPMGSLDKIKTEKAIGKYFSTFVGPYIISDKADGMSLQLVYTKGKPSKLLTRGDGIKGKDISFLLPYLKIPKKLPVAYTVVRVEGIASNAVFSKILSREAGGPFKAVRNAAGGILNVSENSKKLQKAREYAKHLTLMAFKIMDGAGSDLKPSQQLKTLKKWGFSVVPHQSIRVELPFETLSHLLNDRKKRSAYNIDGLVIEQDKHYPIRKGNPKHAVSFKENSVADMVKVVCTGVTWEVSRSSKIIPVVNIRPTMIGGVEVSNFTGHNAFYILHGYLKGSDDHKSGAKPRPIGKGAVLMAVRSGDVIPYIVKVVKGAKSAAAPDMPFKLSGVHYISTGAEGKVETRKKLIAHFINTIGVEGFKQSTVNKFYDNGYTTLNAFLNLKLADFDTVPGMGKRRGQIYLTSLRKALADLDFVTLANASGYFPGLSTEKLSAIYRAFPDILSTKSSRYVLHSRLTAIDGLADKTADVVVKGIPKLVKMISRYGFSLKAPKKISVTSSKMSKLYVTFTGVRNNDLAEYITANGGTVQSMKSTTNLLLIKDDSYSNNKVDKAKDSGVSVMTVDDFISKYKVRL